MTQLDTLQTSSVELNTDKDSCYETLISEGDDSSYCIDNSKFINCGIYKPDQIQKLAGAVNFSLLNLNIRSLKKNFDKLQGLLITMGCNFDIIGCTETHLNDNSYLDLFKLEGYNLHKRNRDRGGKSGGGVCLFCKTSINVTTQ